MMEASNVNTLEFINLGRKGFIIEGSIDAESFDEILQWYREYGLQPSGEHNTVVNRIISPAWLVRQFRPDLADTVIEAMLWDSNTTFTIIEERDYHLRDGYKSPPQLTILTWDLCYGDADGIHRHLNDMKNFNELPAHLLRDQLCGIRLRSTVTLRLPRRHAKLAALSRLKWC